MGIISITIRPEEVGRFIEKYRAAAKNLAPLMKGIAEELHSETLLNFERQGRPKWKDLSDVTRKLRAKRGKDPNGPTLMVTGDLRNSIMANSSADAVELSAGVGLKKKYAAIHQFGGRAGKNRKVDIPARPYLPFEGDSLQPEAEQSIVAFVRDYFENAVG